ncbi:MAG: RNA polymerase sigma factor [Acidobacteriia bacterium]|nr:RNA polymerase sigma factor [Terriglobia bacterium]
MTAISDQVLMQSVRDGELDKLGVLFERHHGMLFNFLLKMTSDRQLSEDLTQEVFVRILKYRHTYRGNSQFTTWMFQIARNARVDHFRKYSGEETVKKDEQLEEFAASGPSPRERLEREQEIKLLHGALQQLSEEQREVLVLSRFHGMKYEQVAEILNCSTGAIKARVFRAMQDLKQHFNSLEGEKVS